ncbi:MAG: GntR family transcriptional regulator [Acidobacteria bacterium]|nr:GntR family transcriptional regulator [Acidobacteriota bacterium]
MKERTPEIVVDRSAEEPAYAQIAGQLRDLIAAGKLAAGSSLPPVRSLASDLGVNLNTVARAYWRLEEEGFVQIRDRSGAEVVAPSQGPPVEREKLQQALRRVLAQMRQAGISFEELRRLTNREIDFLVKGSRG